jgi:hypothetical protein
MNERSCGSNSWREVRGRMAGGSCPTEQRASKRRTATTGGPAVRLRKLDTPYALKSKKRSRWV